MRTVSGLIPRNADALNEERCSTLDPLRGNRLTVTLERPQKVIRVEVLTGPEKQGLNRPRQGQVELGCAPVENSKGCARCSLLGPLVDRNLDQRVFCEEGSMEELSCIRLLVLASQGCWVLIRQIKVWTQEELG